MKKTDPKRQNDHSQGTNPPKHLSRREAQKLRKRLAQIQTSRPLIPFLSPEKAVDAIIDTLTYDTAIPAVGKLAVELLEQGDVDAFFRAIERFGPAMLEVPEVMEILKQWWFQKDQSDGGKARKNLLRLGEALAFVGRGNLQYLTEEEKPKSKRASASRSRSVKRWTKSYTEKYVSLYGDKDSLRQLRADFNTQARFKNPYEKSLAWKEICKRIQQNNISRVRG